MGKNYFKQSFKKASTKFGKSVSDGFDKSWSEHGPHEMSDEFKEQTTSESTWGPPLLSLTRPFLLIGKKAFSFAYNTSKKMLGDLHFKEKADEVGEYIGVTREGAKEKYSWAWERFGGQGDSWKKFTSDEIESLRLKIENSPVGDYMKDPNSYIPKDFDPERMANQVGFGQVNENKFSLKDFNPHQFVEGKVKQIEFNGLPDSKFDISDSSKNLGENFNKIKNIYGDPSKSFSDIFDANSFVNPIGSKNFSDINESSMLNNITKAKEPSSNTNMKIRSINDLGYEYVDKNVFTSPVRDIDKGALSEEIEYYKHEGNTVMKSVMLDDEGALIEALQNFADGTSNNDDYVIADAQKNFILNDDNLKTGKETWKNITDDLDDVMDFGGNDFGISTKRSALNGYGFYKTMSDQIGDSSKKIGVIGNNPFKKSFEKANGGPYKFGEFGKSSFKKSIMWFESLFESIEDRFVLNIWKEHQEDQKKSIEKEIKKMTKHFDKEV